MKKWRIVILLVGTWIFGVVYVLWDTSRNENNEEPYIYQWQYVGWRSGSESYYVYPRFKDNHLFIKYLFDFTNKHSKEKIKIVTKENDLRFEDIGYGIVFSHRESNKNHRFLFVRQDSNSVNNRYIVVNYLKEKDINFQVSSKVSEGSIQGKKLKTNFEDINLNIVQNMLDFARSDSAKFDTDNYTYELYNKDNIKKIVIEYHEKGNWFKIEIL